ncbi:hypothetical protein BLNAU_555 [Blattamonas nauphoetae]|uniref:MRG domain-containing protein n=1 Tax=Blattamonas nauphoetae TaxID=2049346 RepID=A0ABQ9YLK5_9EUKA|nr:hypothetical protein BLNAU_555 [Blattamonas nauphoetae]
MMPHTPQNSEKVKKLYKEALLKEKQRKQAKKKEPVQMEEEQGEESEETSDQTSNEEETSEAPVKKLKRKNYDTSILDSDDGEPLIITKLFIEFSLSQKLKDQLTNDFTMVTQKMLISLPRHPNITAILKGFVLYTYLDDFHTYIFTAKYLPADELDSDYSMYLQWIHQVESEPDIVEGKT